MIISASRRTDIPTYYSDWFFRRLREGFVYARNPLNAHQISHVRLDPDVVDGFVFWTKNPIPMLDKLDQLKDYAYYFQFTLNAYGQDVERGVPSKEREIVPAFQKLSDIIGPDRVIWRYDPIFLNATYTMEYHIRYFEALIKRLHPYTRQCTISFLDLYQKTARNTASLALQDFPPALQRELAKQLADIARSYGLRMETCAEAIDLEDCGIQHAHCIDGKLFETLLGCPLKVGKDKNQRQECGCVESIDIGVYNTCRNGCRYCYANFSDQAVRNSQGKHDPESPLLIGVVGPDDKVTERKMYSLLDRQVHF